MDVGFILQSVKIGVRKVHPLVGAGETTAFLVPNEVGGAVAGLVTPTEPDLGTTITD